MSEGEEGEASLDEAGEKEKRRKEEEKNELEETIEIIVDGILKREGKTYLKMSNSPQAWQVTWLGN